MTGTDPDEARPADGDGDWREEGFDADEQDDIRALLASARADEPIPADVAARLDDTLAGLQRERRQAVVPLHRRLAPRLLAAAAAVVVLGGAAVGVQQVLDRSGGASGEAATTLQEEAPEDAAGDAGSGSKSGVDAGRAEQGPATAAAPLAVVRPGHLREDAARVAADVGAGSFGLAPAEGSAGPESGPESGPGSGTVPPAPPCPGPASVRALPGVSSVPVQYGDQLAALLVRPATGQDPGRRVVEVWTCAGDERLARTVVPLER